METDVVPTIPTPDDIRADMADLMVTISNYKFLNSYIIDDYPIGGRSRGKCELAIDRKGEKWRTAKRTTDKLGRWCGWHHSVYYHGGDGVVIDRDEGYAGWLIIGSDSIYLKFANGSTEILSQNPAPYVRRTQQTVVLRMRPLFGSEATEATETSVLAPDPIERIEAHDAWRDASIGIRVFVANRIKDITPIQ